MTRHDFIQAVCERLLEILETCDAENQPTESLKDCISAAFVELDASEKDRRER